ncbi:MAG: aspartate kinase, partial [Acidobacteria bacterium]|nr:aspartate kinase [Acidobacteriota bacterium]
MKVAKFGGSSLADAAQIRKVCDIITSDADRRLIVVSAPGRRHKGDTKVTDLLIACAEARLAGGSAEKELAAVVDRYAGIARDLGLPADVADRIRADLAGRLAAPTDHAEQFLDTLK